MSHVYDNWEKLVGALVKKEQDRILAYVKESPRSSFSSDSSDSIDSSSSGRFSFDLSSSDQLNEQAPQGGNSPFFATTSSANAQAPRDGIELEVKGDTPTFEVSTLSFDELKEQTYNFGQKAIIAQGSYATVYFAQLKSGKDVALKMFYATRSRGSDSNDKFLTKVSTASRFKHENVVEFLGYCIENDRRILAYEFATMGTLHNVLHRSKRVTGEQTGPILDWKQRVRIAVDVARGLEYLHENAVIHRDIRSSNVLLFNDFKSKTADDQFSTRDYDAHLNPDPIGYPVDLGGPGFGYYAPESIMIGLWTQKSDVFSFGVVLLELLAGRKSLDYNLPRGQQNLVTWAMPQLTEDKVKCCVDPELKEKYPPKAAAKLAAVAALCVQYEAEYRPDMRTVAKALLTLLRDPAPRI